MFLLVCCFVFQSYLDLLTEISDLWLCTSVIKKIKTVSSKEISTSLFRLAIQIQYTHKNPPVGYQGLRTPKRRRG